MKITKIELLTALEAVKAGLANKELIEQTTSFAFIKGKVITYNDEISFSHPLKGLNIEGAVQAEQLYKLLAKLKKEEIDFTLTENEILIQNGKMTAGLALQKEITLPLNELKEKKDWYPIPSKLLKHMKLTVGACSRDMSRPVLTCINIDKKGYVQGSDGFRIAQGVLGEESPIDTFLLPASSALEVEKLAPIEMAQSVGWVHFRAAEGTILSCRILTDKFPDVQPYLVSKGIEIKFPSSILEILERAAVFSKRDHLLDEEIYITLENNRLLLESKSNTGWFKEEVNCKFSEEKTQFKITPYLLKDVLTEARQCLMNEKTLLFQGEDWSYLTMLRK